MNPNPRQENLAPRYVPGQSGNPGGRTPSKWLREYLSAANDKSEDGKTRRLRIAEHLYEVATSWEVVVVGRDNKGELLKVASARDSVAAAALLYSYDMGKPTSGATIRAPKGVSQHSSLLDMLMAACRERIASGELNEAELVPLAQLLVGAEKAEAEMIARLMGDKSAGSQVLRERVERVILKLEQQAEAQAMLPVSPTEPTKEGEP